MLLSNETLEGITQGSLNKMSVCCLNLCDKIVELLHPFLLKLGYLTTPLAPEAALAFSI
jgi:hypothetical protein